MDITGLHLVETEFHNMSIVALENLNIADRRDESKSSARIVNDKTMFYFRVIPWAIICTTIGVFGIVTNVINMAVFIRTGFKDSINISLFALAISDFGSCFTLIFATDATTFWLQTLNSNIMWDEIKYIVASNPHVAFTKITTLITAFITFERCLCVSMPLKVKAIITQNRVIVYLAASYISIIVIMIPKFYSNSIGTRFSQPLNKSVIGLVFTENREQVEEVFYPLLYVTSVLAYIVIIISTVVLVVKLKEKTKWRAKATAMKDNEGITKEQKISKMVITISALFIACLLPTTALRTAMWAERRLSINGAFSNLVKILAYFTFILDSVNSSVNIFIYYRNSSNYKTVFGQIFFHDSVNVNKGN